MINNKNLRKILRRFPSEALTNVKTINASRDEKGKREIKIILEEIENDNEKFLAKPE